MPPRLVYNLIKIFWGSYSPLRVGAERNEQTVAAAAPQTLLCPRHDETAPFPKCFTLFGLSFPFVQKEDLGLCMKLLCPGALVV